MYAPLFIYRIVAPSMTSFASTYVLLAGAIVSAAAHAEWEFSGGAGLRQVRMTETDRNGRQLVQEKGWLPGLELRATHVSGDWRFGMSGEAYSGDIDYDGRLQNGRPFTTDTATTLFRIDLDLARQITEATRIIGGIEWDGWLRDIEGCGAVAGLNERTTSWRLLAGGATRVLQSEWMNLHASALLVIATPETLRVRFQNRIFDDAHLTTKSATGLRLAFELQPAAAPAVTVATDFDWLRIARSDNFPLRRGGVLVGTVAQPEHTRKAFGIRINYRF